MKKFLTLFFILFNLNAFAKDNSLNIITWADYIQPEIFDLFEKETGIKLNIDYIDNNYSLETKLTATSHDYDITVPTLAPFFMRQVQFGIFQPLERDKLKNYKNLDPKVIEYIKANNGDNYAIPFMLDSIGIGYNRQKIEALMPGTKIDSLEFIFNPKKIAKFAQCGIEFLDSAEEIVSLALLYLKLNPNSQNPEDLSKASNLLKNIRPYIKNINSMLYFNNLASGDNCLVVGYSGDIIQAKQIAKKSGNNYDIEYILPKEGSFIAMDLMAIPVNAPHKENAYKFLDFILRADIAASIANYIGYTSPNLASYPLIQPEFINNLNIYPLQQANFTFMMLDIPTQKFNRLRNRTWIKFLSDDL